MYRAIDTLSAALSAARQRLNITASNIANAETTRTAEGGPYQKRMLVQVAEEFRNALDDVSLAKPKVEKVILDESAPKMVYKPGHPDANDQGFVAYPNINVVSEMTELMSVTRAYEAAANAIQTTKQIEERGAGIAGRF